MVALGRAVFVNVGVQKMLVELTDQIGDHQGPDGAHEPDRVDSPTLCDLQMELQGRLPHRRAVLSGAISALKNIDFVM